MKVVGKKGNTTQEKRVSKYLGAEVLRRNPYVFPTLHVFLQLRTRTKTISFSELLAKMSHVIVF